MLIIKPESYLYLPIHALKAATRKLFIFHHKSPKTAILCYDNPTRLWCSTNFSKGMCAQKETKEEWKQIKIRSQHQAGKREIETSASTPRVAQNQTPSHWKKTPKIILLLKQTYQYWVMGPLNRVPKLQQERKWTDFFTK